MCTCVLNLHSKMANFNYKVQNCKCTKIKYLGHYHHVCSGNFWTHHHVTFLDNAVAILNAGNTNHFAIIINVTLIVNNYLLI